MYLRLCQCVWRATVAGMVQSYLTLELDLLFVCVRSIPFRETSLALAILDQDE